MRFALNTHLNTSKKWKPSTRIKICIMAKANQTYIGECSAKLWPENLQRSLLCQVDSAAAFGRYFPGIEKAAWNISGYLCCDTQCCWRCSVQTQQQPKGLPAPMGCKETPLHKADCMQAGREAGTQWQLPSGHLEMRQPCNYLGPTKQIGLMSSHNCLLFWYLDHFHVTPMWNRGGTSRYLDWKVPHLTQDCD